MWVPLVPPLVPRLICNCLPPRLCLPPRSAVLSTSKADMGAGAGCMRRCRRSCGRLLCSCCVHAVPAVLCIHAFLHAAPRCAEYDMEYVIGKSFSQVCVWGGGCVCVCVLGGGGGGITAQWCSTECVCVCVCLCVRQCAAAGAAHLLPAGCAVTAGGAASRASSLPSRLHLPACSLTATHTPSVSQARLHFLPPLQFQHERQLPQLESRLKAIESGG